jgi:serine/threonine protein phosphatase 1
MATDCSRRWSDGAGPPSDRFVRPVREWGTETSLADASFSDAIAKHHWRFDADEYDNVYVVGDVHGCLDELRTLWGRIGPTADEMVVFVGDLVRKGPASADVVEFVSSRPNAVSVRGNNETKILDNQVDTTPFEPVMADIASLPLVVSWDDSLAVHGGIDTRRSLSDQQPHDILETRAIPPENGYDGPFWFEQYDGPGRVFFGHTVLAEPFVSEGAVGLDTGCVYGGELTAYDCNREECISVPANKTYEQRADDKILDV